MFSNETNRALRKKKEHKDWKGKEPQELELKFLKLEFHLEIEYNRFNLL